MNYKAKQKIKEHIVDFIDDFIGEDIAELHYFLFNQDYWIIGNYEAEEWIKNNTDGVFATIEEIKEYEQDNFGEVNTDLSSSEHVCNMITYIYGEEILHNLDSIADNWDEKLTKELAKKIKEELSN